MTHRCIKIISGMLPSLLTARTCSAFHISVLSFAEMESLNLPAQSASSNTNPSTTHYLDTTAAYDLWSEVYDTDGNFLQALDTLEMHNLIPIFLSQIITPQPWKLVDLGCGTGRNTLKLLHLPGSIVTGLDASSKMLAIAKGRVEMEMKGLSLEQKVKHVEFRVYDILRDNEIPVAPDADAIISTLVIEHVPIEKFFAAAWRILKPGGSFLVTNMHSDMGEISQAGFVDPRTGEKIRPRSFAHRLEDVIEGAARHGFEITCEPLERAVDKKTSEVLGPRASKWIGVTVWFAACFRRKG